MSDKNEGIIIILSSPSGAGKTTLVKKILSKKEFSVSISHTTRKPRRNEIHGSDYFFVSQKEFKKLILDEKFLEYANVFHNYYGSSKELVLDKLSKGQNVVFDIDWQGTKQLTKFKELNLVKIFSLPPSKKELERRLIERNKGKNEKISERLAAFEKDATHWNDYDYVIINDNLENCFKQIEKIIESHQIKSF